MELPDFNSVVEAAARLAGHAVRTPMLRHAGLDVRVARQVFLKPEMLQISGSFKFRGAYNRIAQLSAPQRAAGVIAWSSGNHAQGVAAAAARLGVRARIVMPADAPRIKLENTQALGGEVITYDRRRESREEIAFALAAREGGVIVPSFDDPHIIAGQGTTGLELLQDVAALDAGLDALLICCGGGGLTAGCALAAEGLSPDTDLFCVEPAHYDDHARSLSSGVSETANTDHDSICDALLAPRPGELTFAINGPRLAGGLVVDEAQVMAAMRYAYRDLKLVVEPGGAVALAALLADVLDPRYERVGIILSGGNVDPDRFAQIILGEAAVADQTHSRPR
ncbi:MAG: threonine/serine dehydratase [Pseudomonadota bacterium]